ncbi:MAG TPA: hypothetical protein VNV41_20540 [Candidatus Acidoferrales bacterium]|jgi:hypothetical protein|nr:hypothetical protein [Candidatus Acidoferrales bacterium]
MAHIFDGLYEYEEVMLVRGRRDVRGAAPGLDSGVRQGEAGRRLLMIFVLPIIRVGFPGIEVIKIRSSEVDIAGAKASSPTVQVERPGAPGAP